jgi:hypothetical protein
MPGSLSILGCSAQITCSRSGDPALSTELHMAATAPGPHGLSLLPLPSELQSILLSLNWDLTKSHRDRQ